MGSDPEWTLEGGHRGLFGLGSFGLLVLDGSASANRRRIGLRERALTAVVGADRSFAVPETRR
jgi:hypothetical protein